MQLQDLSFKFQYLRDTDFYETIVFMVSIENRCSVCSEPQPGPSQFCYEEGYFATLGIKDTSDVIDHCSRMVSLFLL